MDDWVSKMKRKRASMNIMGVTRLVHRPAKRLNKDTGKVETGMVTEEVFVVQHDISRRTKKGPRYWRGACLG
jgi:hypothetical protein